MSAPAAPPALVPIAFSDLAGWSGDDHAAAFAAFRRSAVRLAGTPAKTRALGVSAADLAAAAAAALALGEAVDGPAARGFFEAHFEPVRVVPPGGDGFLTGYYEPEVAGSRTRSDAFPTPLYAPPADLVELAPDDPRDGLDTALTWARRLADGRLVEHPDRAAVMAGALDGRGLELAHVASWVEAFFIHVQGSARIRLADGDVLRVTFAAKSGHPYFAIARVLVERGLMTPAEATADVLRRFLEDHPEDAAAVMARNRSFIFFREAPVPDPALGPIAAAGVPLTPGRSLAVDRTLHTFHTPVFVEADIPAAVHGEDGPFRRLMIAQDTGSAILGPARGDIFFGTGAAAFDRAARVRHPGRFTLLVPKAAGRGP